VKDNEHWLRGGFPESTLARTESDSFRWRRNFIRSYLERDVSMFAPRMPASTIGRLWTMLAHSQGTILNNARLAQALAVSAPTVHKYIDLLCDLLLVRRIQPWSGNITKRLVKSPKVYVRDSGIVHALLEVEHLNDLFGHPILGVSWEGFVIDELLKAVPRRRPLFYRTQDGAELDLVFERGGKPHVAIEVKRGSAPRVEAGFKIACDDLAIEHRLIIYSGTDTYPAKNGAVVHSLKSAIDVLTNLLL
jgi:uncharacterized protein